MRRPPINSWRHVLLLGLGCWVLASVPTLGAQKVSTTPDTAAARRIVDSLVRAGSWRLTIADTIRPAPDTVHAGALSRDDGLRLMAMFAGILVVASLAISTISF